MSKKAALMVATALTVFVLLTVAGVAAALGVSMTAPDSAAAAAPQPIAPVEVSEPLLDREREYADRIEEANVRLQQGYSDIQDLQLRIQELEARNATLIEREEVYRSQLQEANRLLTGEPQLTMNGAVATSPARTSQGVISPETAAEIASRYLGGAMIREVELEEERGLTVYEVETDRSEVYVDAYSGEVVYVESDDHDDHDEGHDDD